MAFSEKLNFTQNIFHTCENQRTLFLLIIFYYSRLNLKLQEHIFCPKQAWQMTFHFKLRWSALISRLINGHNQDAATTTHLHAYPLHTCILKTLHAYFVECGKHKKEWQNKPVLDAPMVQLNKLSWTVSIQSLKSKKIHLHQKLLLIKTVIYLVFYQL